MSYVEILILVQWIFMAGLVLGMLALARQVGVLHRRLGPAGALMTSGALKVGNAVPEMTVSTVTGRQRTLGGPDAEGRSTLIAFVAPDCPVCSRLIPIYKRIAQEFSGGLNLVFASDEAVQGHDAYRKRVGIENFDYMLSTDLGMRFEIGKLPYAVLIDADGVLRSKGLVNSREHLESLVESMLTGYESIQDYLVKEQQLEQAS